MRWFRWYEGTSEDGKFRLVARNATVTVATVMGVWAVLLEDASHAEHRGIAQRGEDFYAAILELPAEQLQTILESMDDAGLISVGHGAITITKWKERQFETDTTDGTNAERQRRFRQKHKANASVTDSNGSVTAAKRPDTDTDTDTEKKKETRVVALSIGWPINANEFFWNVWPNKVGKPAAMKALAAAQKRGAEFNAIIAGVEQYIRDKPPDRQWLNPATFLNQNRWEDQPATVSVTYGKPKNPIIQAADDLCERLASFDGPPREPDELRSAEGKTPARLLSHG